MEHLKKWWWAYLILGIGIVVILGKKYGWFKKTIDGNKGTPPSGCGENQRGIFEEGSQPYYYKFNRPYFKYNTGNKIIGNCKRISGGDFSDTWDCDTISFYYNGKSQEVPSDVLDELDKVTVPVVGFEAIYGYSGCTKPIYDTSIMPNASEICFTGSDLELQNGEIVPDTIKVAYRNLGTKIWHFNRVTSGGTYCYVYNPSGKYPLI